MKASTIRALKEAGRVILLCGAVLLGLSLLWAQSGCTAWRAHPTEVRMWASVDKNGSPVGNAPVGNVMVTQPLPWYMEAHVQHMSSIPDEHDPGEINQIGLGFCVKVPLERCN